MEITFKDITRIIKKNIVFIAVLSLLCAAASYFVTTFFVPKTYTSTVKLYVETNYKSQSAYDDYQSINYAKNLVLTYIELLDSNSFYNSVSKELNEKYTASQLKSMIKFESIEDTEVCKFGQSVRIKKHRQRNCKNCTKDNCQCKGQCKA